MHRFSSRSAESAGAALNGCEDRGLKLGCDKTKQYVKCETWNVKRLIEDQA
jgi:hypothetical protein